MKIYTKTGDKGQTSLFGGAKRPKFDPQVETYGRCDELNNVLGTVVSHIRELPESELNIIAREKCLRSSSGKGEILAFEMELKSIQADLFKMGSLLAGLDPTRHEKSFGHPGYWQDRILFLEGQIDGMSEKLPPLTSFILPGGTIPGAGLHLVRGATRAFERALAALTATDEGLAHLEDSLVGELLAFTNRLSDYAFVAARFVNWLQGQEDIPVDLH